MTVIGIVLKKSSPNFKSRLFFSSNKCRVEWRKQKYIKKDRRGSKLDQNKLDDIFSGLFWVGNKAIDLGLADGIGAIKPILEEKFGKKIKIKIISQKKSFLQRRFSSSIFNSDEILNKIEERIMFSRFGL